MSAASRQLLASVRQTFQDLEPIAADEGIPDGLANLLGYLPEGGKVKFSLGSSVFSIQKNAEGNEAVCEFPVKVQPVAWRYIQIFVVECAPLFKTLTLRFQPASTCPDDAWSAPGATQVHDETRELLSSLKVKIVEVGSHPAFKRQPPPEQPPAAIAGAEAAPEGPATLWFATSRRYGAETEDISQYGYELADRRTVGQYWAETKQISVIPPEAESMWYKELMQHKDILVFIHGYNNTFQESLDAATEITKALRAQNSEAAVVLYSWPARGNAGRSGFWATTVGKLAFFEDLKRINDVSTKSLFQEFIRHLEPVLDRVILLGHSMGNELMMQSLATLSSDVFLTPSPKRNFRAVFSVAPAVRQTEWIAHARTYHLVTGARVFLCCCCADMALLACSWAEFHDPAGRIREVPLLSPAFHTFEVPAIVAAIDPSSCHSYYHAPPLIELVCHVFDPSRDLKYGLTRGAGTWYTLDRSGAVTTPLFLQLLSSRAHSSGGS